jgi:hypothetical protein
VLSCETICRPGPRFQAPAGAAGLTVIVAMAGMFLSGMQLFAGFAVATISVVLIGPASHQAAGHLIMALSRGPSLQRMVNWHLTSAGSPHQTLPSWSR